MMRPNPSILLPGEDASDAASLEVACKLLFSGKPAPGLKNGFLYCHPSFVRGEQEPDAGQLMDPLAENARLLAQRAPFRERVSGAIANLLLGRRSVEVSAPPPWVGAMQRYLESAILEEVRRSGGDVLVSNLRPGSAKAAGLARAAVSATRATLAELECQLVKFSSKSGS
jgi:hypothetical protein